MPGISKVPTRPKRSLSSQPSALSPAALRGGARGVALAALIEVERRGAFADEALDAACGRAPLDPRDRALANEVVYGVLRCRAALDWRLEHVMDRPMERLPLPVKTTLRLGGYQILHLDRIPSSAAVNQSVELMKAKGGRYSQRWAGFVNAVLRALIRAPAPSWPDQTKDPVDALTIRYSCPAWLVERWLTRFGFEQAESLCRALLLVPPLTLRANALRVSRDELLEDLARSGYMVKPTLVSPGGIVIEKCGPVTELRQFYEGACYVEDEAGQLIPPLLAPQPGERVLDACAAPGGKATHLGALMQNRGEIIAMDNSPRRLRLLEENCQRLGVTIISPVECDLTTSPTASAHGALGPGSFDRALVDAPCSGLGVLKRHPEAKWQKAASDLTRHHAKQVQLLDRVGALLRPGGRLVYSTCSTEPEENEQVIEQFLRNHEEFTREPLEPFVPQAGRSLLTSQGDLSTIAYVHVMDVFFACRLRKDERK